MIPIPNILFVGTSSSQSSLSSAKRKNGAEDDADNVDDKQEQQRLRIKSAIRLRNVFMKPRYDPYHFNHDNFGIARFLQQNQDVTEQEGKKKERVMMLSLRRKSLLTIFLVSLFQFVLVDTYYLLPSGIFLYVIALQISYEQWMDEIEYNAHFEEQQKLHQKKVHELQLEIKRAQFEYHVLRNLPDYDIIPMYRPIDGALVFYALNNRSYGSSKRNTKKGHEIRNL
jgi:hypothetical protein